ncbi:hypothetical protein HYU11_00680 [Candidatus Woesearchaeota archaeon]|nr:hypothetical protein [Candidatus Woesearchaeota archaeon]
MKAIKAAFLEVKFSVLKTSIFEGMVNSIMIFLAAYLAMSLFGIPIIIPLAITAAYLIFDISRRAGMDKVREVEAYYPKLNEKLRTAEEYSMADNPVVNELHLQVIGDLRNVEESEFIDERKLVSKAGIIALLCLMILLISPVSISLDFAEPVLDKARIATEINVSLDFSDQPSGKGAGGNKDGAIIPGEFDIYGVSSMAKLGEDELNLVIRPAGDTINVRQTQEIKTREFSENYASEVQAVTASVFEEKIPKEQQEIVKNYFTAIAKG